MRKLFSLLLCMLILYTVCVPAYASDGKPDIAAKACALMDASSGRVLYQVNGDVSLPMASTTKVMTALVVLENADLGAVVEIGKKASGVEGSSMFLEVGEKLTVEQLLLGLMMRSGNDAAVALAEYVGGSLEGFVEMMNAKAKEMGLADTHFKNPHGLPAEGHYTSALDLCKIMAEAISIPDFERIVTTRRVQVPWDGHAWDRVMTSKNRLLDEMPGCIGGKTGFTKEAGRCLVEAAERNEMRLVSVVLNCPDWWNQTQKLMNYGFDNYAEYTFLEAGEWVHEASTGGTPAQMDIVAEERLSLVIGNGEELSLRLEVPTMPDPPYAAGAPLGVATALVDGEAMATVRLVAGDTVEKNGVGDTIRRILGFWLGDNPKTH